ncbi:unnamed protein product [Bursaphelenchus okinawaensis]|uniref:Uncharacterized protein n=1 Tax=Bursaphelenchus okinawaensis TaxID=465554 RepID=A0A811L9Q2_9BILA|nr:unnamed protein product [Bursaphelenchus okinawaensis]CAG9119818.1 unnamed protein product [Bursaphelenchus okinawaensis]
MESSNKGKDAGNLLEKVKVRKSEKKEILDGLGNLYTTIEELRRQIRKGIYIRICVMCVLALILSFAWLYMILNL